MLQTLLMCIRNLTRFPGGAIESDCLLTLVNSVDTELSLREALTMTSIHNLNHFHISPLFTFTETGYSVKRHKQASVCEVKAGDKSICLSQYAVICNKGSMIQTFQFISVTLS